MPANHEKLGPIHQKILALLKDAPQGLTIYEIRDRIPEMGVQQHLDRRVRELRYYYDIPRKNGRYFYQGIRAAPVADSGEINAKLRAEVLNRAHGRCQMCGRTIPEDGIKLQVDHKIPRNWGGETVAENLWALCELCNNGKRDFFSSFDPDEMRRVVAHDSVYERIAELLHLHMGQPVPSWLIEFVANVEDFQDDWPKRLRELRYPVIGLKIKVARTKLASGKVQTAYTLQDWKPLPPDHKFLIKDFERKNKTRRFSD
jgi:HNH endonuclease